ncbi:guanylate kinase [Mesoaciditoga lauensis]|uniref:guanylate kinase n=1 Tax=Mesoaciditoga lauensis TaxID=1495039 RepID=UPI0005650460|nr:guanylate kinase [Mesoaciditoga lauensis]
MEGILFVMSGPSGAGKTTIVKGALRELEDVEFSVSYTTRPKRENEVDGRDYFFVTKAEFEELRKKGEFLEWQEVHGHLYGTSKNYVKSKMKSGVNVLLDIDVKGAMSVKKQIKEAVFIFVAPPSFKELKERLIKRHTEGKEDLEKRIEDAKYELSMISEFDYLIVNHDVDQSIKQLESIIIAEQIKVSRRGEFVGKYKFYKSVARKEERT